MNDTIRCTALFGNVTDHQNRDISAGIAGFVKISLFRDLHQRMQLDLDSSYSSGEP